MARGITVRLPDRPRDEAEYEATRAAVQAGRDVYRWIYFDDGEIREIADSCPNVGIDRERFLDVLGYDADAEPIPEKELFETPAGRIEPDEAKWLMAACRKLATHWEGTWDPYGDKLRELAAVCETGIDVGIRPSIDR